MTQLITNCPLWCDPCLMDGLTKRAPYKMYEIIASSNRWPRLSRPLTSSVTEPPVHNCKRRCQGERKTAGHIQKKNKKMLRKKANYWPDIANLQITKLQVRIIKLQMYIMQSNLRYVCVFIHGDDLKLKVPVQKVDCQVKYKSTNYSDIWKRTCMSNHGELLDHFHFTWILSI